MTLSTYVILFSAFALAPHMVSQFTVGGGGAAPNSTAATGGAAAAGAGAATAVKGAKAQRRFTRGSY